MLAENARTKRAGQCVVETADVRDLILAVEFNLAERLRALETTAQVYTPPALPRTFEVRSDTGPLEASAEMDIPEPPPMQPIPLRKEATVEQAYAAWQNGATGVRPIQRALGIPYSTARDLVIEMQRQGLIPPQTQASGGE